MYGFPAKAELFKLAAYVTIHRREKQDNTERSAKRHQKTNLPRRKRIESRQDERSNSDGIEGIACPVEELRQHINNQHNTGAHDGRRKRGQRHKEEDSNNRDSRGKLFPARKLEQDKVNAALHNGHMQPRNHNQVPCSGLIEILLQIWSRQYLSPSKRALARDASSDGI